MTDLLSGTAAAPADLASHLAGCGACRDHLERMRRTWKLASGSSGAIEPSPESWVRLKEEMAGLQEGWESARRIRRAIAMALAFALPVLAVLAWLLLKKGA